MFRKAIISGVGVLLAGALYLIYARGAAILLDLSAMAAMFCL